MPALDKLAEDMPALDELVEEVPAQDELMEDVPALDKLEEEPVELTAVQPMVPLKEVPPELEVPLEILEEQPKEELPQEMAPPAMMTPLESLLAPPVWWRLRRRCWRHLLID